MWNPAFDVTPASLITGIITEQGIIQRQDGAIDVNGFLREHGLLEAEKPQENGDQQFSLSSMSSSVPCSSEPLRHYFWKGYYMRWSTCMHAGQAG